MDDTGLEPKNVSSCSENHLEKSEKVRAAESGAVGAFSVRLGPDLAQVVDARPNLPEAIRKAILMLVKG